MVSKETNGVETDGGLKELSALAQPALLEHPLKDHFLGGFPTSPPRKATRTRNLSNNPSQNLLEFEVRDGKSGSKGDQNMC